MEEKHSFCRLCGSFCALVATVEDNQVLSIRPDDKDPVSQGYMCIKGVSLGKLHHHPHRLDEPRIRGEDGVSVATWDAVLDDIGQKLREIIATSGPGAIGGYVGTPGAPCSSVGVWRNFMQALGTPQVYSTISVDVACGPLVAERVAGYPMLAVQPDQDAKMVILIGINPMISHGHNFFMPAPKKQLLSWANEGELWVIDPRRSETAELATHHLAPWPGSEFMLLGHAIRELLKDGADEGFLQAYAQGVETLRTAVDRFTLEATAAGTRLTADIIEQFVSAIRRTGRIGLICGTGISMGRNANVTWFLKWALLAVTGSLDRKGGAYLNPGFTRRLDEVGWTPMNSSGPGPKSRPDLPSRLGEYPVAAIPDEIEANNLRALFVIAGNPVIAFPDTNRMLEALKKLDLLIVIDIIDTATTELATHLLPSTGMLEMSDVTLWDFVNPVEYARYAERVVEPTEGRRHVWWVLKEISDRIGIDMGLPADITDEDDVIRPMMAGARASFEQVKAERTIVSGRTYEWIHRFLPDGRWNLGPEDLIGQLRTAKPGDDEIVLTPRRQKNKINGLFNDGLTNPRRPDRAELCINPDDAADRGIADGDAVTISTDAGSITAPAKIDPRYRRGVVSLPHGFSDINVNMLTDVRDVDLLSGMPTLGAFGVRINRA